MREKKIIMTGGSGRFAQIFKKIKNNKKIYYPSKKDLNLKNLNSIEKYVKKIKPDYLIHCAALSRPMDIHEKNIEESITTNIIGTSNIVRICSQEKIKLIYFSTNYVYPGIIGNYKENSALYPVNNYAWSKLGGEASVKLYKNSLIIRVCMTEKPFVHKSAFANVKSNFIYHEDVPKLLFKLLNEFGIINLGGKAQTIYNFAKKDNKQIKKAYLKKKILKGMPFNSTMNLKKLNFILKTKRLLKIKRKK